MRFSENLTDAERVALEADLRMARSLVWGQAWTRLLRIAAPIVVARIFGQADLGGLSAVVLVYSTATIWFTAGLPKALLYFSAGKSRAEQFAIARKIAGILFQSGLILALLSRFGGLMASRLSSPGPNSSESPDSAFLSVLPYIVWLGAYAIVDLPTKVLGSVAVCERRPWVGNAYSVWSAATLLSFSLVPYALGYGVQGVVLGVVGSGVINALVAGLLFAWLYRGARWVKTELQTTEILRFSIPLGATEVVNQLGNSLDLWIIALYFAATDLAIYQQGAWQIPVLTGIAYAVATAQLPRLRTHFQNSELSAALGQWRAATARVAEIVVPGTLIFALAPGAWMSLLFGDAYQESGPIFGVYCVLTITRVCSFGNLLISAGKPREVLVASAFSLFCNALLSFPFVWMFGRIGPALGTALAFFPTVIFYLWRIQQHYQVPLRQIFPLGSYLRVLVAYAPAAAASVFFAEFFQSDSAQVASVAAAMFANWAIRGWMRKRA